MNRWFSYICIVFILTGAWVYADSKGIKPGFKRQIVLRGHKAELTVGKKLGEGEAGTVYAATIKPENEPLKLVTIKVIKQSQKSFPLSHIIWTHKKLSAQVSTKKTPNLLMLLEPMKIPETGEIFMIQGFAKGGALSDYLPELNLAHAQTEREGDRSIRRIALVAEALKKSLNQLQRLDMTEGRPPIHRDIKPDNIFLMGYWHQIEKGKAQIVLGDYETVTPEGVKTEYNTAGTADYMLLQDKLPTVEADIIAMGNTLYHLLTGNTAKKAYARKYFPDAVSLIYLILHDRQYKRKEIRQFIAEELAKLRASTPLSKKGKRDFDYVARIILTTLDPPGGTRDEMLGEVSSISKRRSICRWIFTFVRRFRRSPP